MEIVGKGNANGNLSQVPKPPVYLSDAAKEHYKLMAKKLIKVERLKETYLSALEIYAEAMSQWEFANRRIREMNKKDLGSGYIQTYSTGATNITTEMSIRDKSIKILFDCFKQFGLDPSSDKGLKQEGNPNQLNAFDQLEKLLKSGTV